MKRETGGEGDKWLDNTLVYLKRQYSKDELVSALTVRLNKKETEIGVLNSEKDELEYANKMLISKIAALENQIKNIQRNNSKAQRGKISQEIIETDVYKRLHLKYTKLIERTRKIQYKNSELIAAIVKHKQLNPAHP